MTEPDEVLQGIVLGPERIDRGLAVVLRLAGGHRGVVQVHELRAGDREGHGEQRPGRRRPRRSERGTGARSARSSLYLQRRAAPGGGAAHVGEHQVLEADCSTRSRPGRGSGRRCARSACVCRSVWLAEMTCWSLGERCRVAAGAGEPVVRGQQLVDVAGQLDPGADEHDQVVADPFQVGDQVRGQHDADAPGPRRSPSGPAGTRAGPAGPGWPPARRGSAARAAWRWPG